jgi:hypothetical protein
MKEETKKTLLWVGIGLAAFGVTAFIFRKKIGKAAALNRKAAKLALEEFKTWNYGAIKEGSSSTMDRLRAYWTQVNRGGWSSSEMASTAWSAAFISYIMHKSGAGNSFKYSTRHSDYIVDSIKNRKQNNKNPFKGYRPEEVKVEVGDLVCYPRAGSSAGYDTTGNYTSHCDIVTSVSKDGASSIGGNVSNSVSKTLIPLRNGKIDRSRDRKKYFVVIKRTK